MLISSYKGGLGKTHLTLKFARELAGKAHWIHLKDVLVDDALPVFSGDVEVFKSDDEATPGTLYRVDPDQ